MHMEADGRMLEDIAEDLEPLPLPLPEAAQLARSARNIAQWRTYLPTDCVAAMVRQGWDRSVA
jgi:hypothetical protein